MTRASFTFVWIALVGSLQTLTAQPVVRFSGEGSLERRWDWAVKEASSTKESEFWVVYSIKRLMDEDSYVATDSYFNGTVSSSNSLYQQFDPTAQSEDALKTAAKRGLRRFGRDGSNPEKKLKDIALIFKLSDQSIVSIDLCNFELDFSFKKRLVYWLGTIEVNESASKLSAVFPSMAENTQRKHCVEAMGMHQSPDVLPFLTKVLESDEQPEVRAEAASWIGEQRTNSVLPLLEKTAVNATTDRLAEASISGIARVGTDESTDLLIKLAKTGSRSKLRRKAAIWLGQVATTKSTATLNDILESDTDVEVQKQALYGLAQQRDEATIDRLVRIARTHPKPSIRKQAIYMLSDKAQESEKALDALIEFTKK